MKRTRDTRLAVRKTSLRDLNSWEVSAVGGALLVDTQPQETDLCINETSFCDFGSYVVCTGSCDSCAGCTLLCPVSTTCPSNTCPSSTCPATTTCPA